MIKFRKMLGYDWNAITGHIKSLTNKEYSVSYLREVIKGRAKNKVLIPILEEMGLMEERK
jgi:hypothetical protein